MKCVQAFVDEATHEKRIRRLGTRDAAADSTANYIDDMALEGVAIKCIIGDGAG